jgi:glutamate-5-semialdehyde dehydrogenase
MLLTDIARQTRQAARELASLSTEAKNKAIEAIAAGLEAAIPNILEANTTDCEAYRASEGFRQAIYDRLHLSESKLIGTIAGVRDLLKLADPVGNWQIHRKLDKNLIMKRISCPLGVLGVVFEARPDALIQISSLAIKSGNGAILKGGKEATQSCQVLMRTMQQALATTEVNPHNLALLTTREEINELLKLDRYVDLIIPRGSNEFVRYVQDNTRIPVLGHADGICHLYIDTEADLAQATTIAVDAKTQYPAACNAIETLLVHETIAPTFLPQVRDALVEKGVKLLGDEKTRSIIDILPASDSDWKTEYSDLILSIKVVASLEEAIEHINTYGSRHTEAIVTKNDRNAAIFLDRVDAAGVFHNCSTRFSDGFRYGFGAEVGISTQKMPPRGPVGLEGLITYKYQIVGDGQIAATYTGKDAKSFLHEDLD